MQANIQVHAAGVQLFLWNIPIILDVAEGKGDCYATKRDCTPLIVDAAKLENTPKQFEMNAEQFQCELLSHYGISPAWKQESSKQSGENPSMKKKMKERTGTQPEDTRMEELQGEDKGKSTY